MRIVGIDPGSRKAGFAIVEVQNRKLVHIASGSIILNSEDPIPERLLVLFQDLEEVFTKYKPQELAIENVFFAKNAQSALRLGQARGVVLLNAAKHLLEVFEYSPTEIKSSICGSGRASKEQIQHMIRLLLGLHKNFQFASPDQADALAICLTHIQTRKTTNKWRKDDRLSDWQNSSKDTHAINH